VKAFEHFVDWPCETLAAGVLAPDGSVHTHGDVDHRFPLASVTKILTAMAIHLAVEERTLALADVHDDDGATLADLLGHASGIAADGERLDHPGRRRIYSNAGYERAANALALAAEMPFGDYLTEGVFEPLDIPSTKLVGSAAHGAESTVGDLLSFLRGFRGLLAPSTIETMTTPYLPELIGVLPGYGRQTPNTWGLGPEIRGRKSPHWTGSLNSAATWGHFGAAGTFVWVDPVAATSMIVLTDRDFGEWAIPRWPSVSDAVLTELGVVAS
jgi:CubicO group peptidase (beta-lactamase class C family)